jgi:adenylosuccinate lyase
MTDIVSGMRVFPERMRRNLDATGGLVFSGQLMLDLIEAGAPREDAYKWVQEHAMAAWESDTELQMNFRQRVVGDSRIKVFLDRNALEKTFDLGRHLRYVEAIFERVFK